MNEPVQSERRGAVLVLTMNRPGKRNAATHEMAQLMASAFELLDSDPALRVGILTGGNGDFCSGMDLQAFLSGQTPRVAGKGFGGLSEAPPAKPLIAAVEGFALGGGFEMALACDMIVASRAAQFGLPEVKRGLIASAGGLLRLPYQIPYRIAAEIIMTGDMVSAEFLERHGVVNQLVEPGQALTAALRLADRIIANAPLAVSASKRVMQESRDWPRAEMFARQQLIKEPIAASQDAKEGVRSFIEKRAPAWIGS
ncbi:crotonase/enoyl-CoA hydratase family protein [Piscinibacter sakaiensis]|uniref:crotonase/enoyl-CoA hydratase family protein n=1 Tax=Piscinibacter sakaiensis TaxID=1547922 RepID=UPI003AAC4110